MTLMGRDPIVWIWKLFCQVEQSIKTKITKMGLGRGTIITLGLLQLIKRKRKNRRAAKAAEWRGPGLTSSHPHAGVTAVCRTAINEKELEPTKWDLP